MRRHLGFNQVAAIASPPQPTSTSPNVTIVRPPYHHYPNQEPTGPLASFHLSIPPEPAQPASNALAASAARGLVDVPFARPGPSRSRADSTNPSDVSGISRLHCPAHLTSPEALSLLFVMISSSSPPPHRHGRAWAGRLACDQGAGQTKYLTSPAGPGRLPKHWRAWPSFAHQENFSSQACFLAPRATLPAFLYRKGHPGPIAQPSIVLLVTFILASRPSSPRQLDSIFPRSFFFVC